MKRKMYAGRSYESWNQHLGKSGMPNRSTLTLSSMKCRVRRWTVFSSAKICFVSSICLSPRSINFTATIFAKLSSLVHIGISAVTLWIAPLDVVSRIVGHSVDPQGVDTAFCKSSISRPDGNEQVHSAYSQYYAMTRGVKWECESRSD